MTYTKLMDQGIKLTQRGEEEKRLNRSASWNRRMSRKTKSVQKGTGVKGARHD